MDYSESDVPRRICLDTYTKVNVWLGVDPLRPGENFHYITSLFLPLMFGDQLTVSAEPSATPDFKMTSNRPDLVAGNTVEAAWRAFLGALPETKVSVLSVTARLTKRVAEQTGLGGGSGDAGSMLNALNEVHGNPFDKTQLKVIARSVGSDVPFFVDPWPCIVRGDGGEMKRVPALAPLFCCLVIPGFRIHTCSAYDELDRLMAAEGDQAGIPAVGIGETLTALLERRPLRPAGVCLNVFERVLGENARVVAHIRETLDNCGAILTTLSGSGSAVCGIYAERAAALAAARSVKRALDDAHTVVAHVI